MNFVNLTIYHNLSIIAQEKFKYLQIAYYLYDCKINQFI